MKTLRMDVDVFVEPFVGEAPMFPYVNADCYILNDYDPNIVYYWNSKGVDVICGSYQDLRIPPGATIYCAMPSDFSEEEREAVLAWLKRQEARGCETELRT